MKRTDALLTDRIARNIQTCSKAQCLWAIHNFWQRLAVNIPDYWMKEAGANIPGCFDYR